MKSNKKRISTIVMASSYGLSLEDSFRLTALSYMREQPLRKIITKLIQEELRFYKNHIDDFFSNSDHPIIKDFCEKNKIKLDENLPFKISDLDNRIKKHDDKPKMLSEMISEIESNKHDLA